jgi:predicted transposase YbfD/YdcC
MLFPPLRLNLEAGESGHDVPLWLRREWKETGVVFTHAKEVSKGHGRWEEREAWALSDPSLNGYAGCAGTAGESWPHLSQVICVKRQRTIRGKTQVEVAYLVSSASPEKANAKRLLESNRAYWGIENRLHWVRDETLGEDRSQVRAGNAPQVMAALRNLTLGLLRRTETVNVAAALRTFAGRPHAAVALVLAPLTGVMK